MLDRPPAAAERKRERHRERQRRYRQRQEEGHVTLAITFTPDETDKLYRLHYLTACELENRKRIDEAIHAMLADIIIDA